MKLTVDMTSSDLLIDELQHVAGAYDALAMLAQGANETTFTCSAEPEHVAMVLRVLNSLQQSLLDELNQYQLTQKH